MMKFTAKLAILLLIGCCMSVSTARAVPSTDPEGTQLYLPLITTSLAAAPPGLQEWTFHKTADGLHPDANEQQLVWLMNRARANPAQEGIWLATTAEPEIANGREGFRVDAGLLQSEFAGYTAKPPAAFDVRLYNAAKAHSDDLIARDAQDHNNQFLKVEQAGFHYWSARGSVFAFARNSLYAHAALNIDWGGNNGTGMQPSRGHRKAIMSVDGDYTNVGLAMVPEDDSNTRVGPLVYTGNYCSADVDYPDHFSQFIVGTVWRDVNSNGRYDPGEGVGNVTVTPSQGKYYAVTANGGGYAIPVEAPGAYTVSFSGAATGSVNVMIGSVSVLVDWQEAATNQLHTSEKRSSEPYVPIAPPPGIRFR